MLAEGAAPVAEYDTLFALFEDVEIALDTPLQIHQHRADLISAKRFNLQSTAVGAIDMLAHRAADNADVSRRFVEANDLLKRAGQFPKQRTQEDVGSQRHGQIADAVGPCVHGNLQVLLHAAART
ncbi:hypothetical protein RSP03_42570 [Cereibacter sphaeroides]|nr:hypothetical protein RSP03_42570 [Cereibacter sphaeroides]